MSTQTYIVHHFIPWEGSYEAFRGGIDALRDWLRLHKDIPADDLAIYAAPDFVEEEFIRSARK